MRLPEVISRTGLASIGFHLGDRKPDACLWKVQSVQERPPLAAMAHGTRASNTTNARR